MTAPTQADADQLAREGLIRQLFAADRGKKPDESTLAAYLLALRRMETPRLARVVERLLSRFERGDTELYRVPQPGTLWRVARELREGAVPRPAPAPLDLHGAPAQKFDDWDTAANLLLLAYVTDPIAKRAHRYAPDSPYVPQKRHIVVGDITKARTAVLVRWKDLWARDMREDRELYGGKLEGKKYWFDCMSKAEAEIDAMIAAERAAA